MRSLINSLLTVTAAYQNLLLRKIHIPFLWQRTHQKIIKDIPIVGFRRGKTLEDILVRATKVPSWVIIEALAVDVRENVVE